MSNTIVANDSQAVIDAFVHIYGIDIKKAGINTWYILMFKN